MQIIDARETSTMSQPSEPQPDIAAAIAVLRHDALAAGRNLDWDDIRRRIRNLVKQGRPSAAERLELLHLYDAVMTKVERQAVRDPLALRRLGYQRANDMLAFLLAEARDAGDVLDPEAFTAIIARELAAGRLRRDEPLQELLSWVLREVDDRGGRPAPGVSEAAAPFLRPSRLSPPPASLSSSPCR